MHSLEPPLSEAGGPILEDDDAFPEPGDLDLPGDEAEAEEDPEPLDDEGFDISEFDDEDEDSLYDDDDELFIAGDEDLPDDPDEDDGDDDDDDGDDEDDTGWLYDQLTEARPD